MHPELPQGQSLSAKDVGAHKCGIWLSKSAVPAAVRDRKVRESSSEKGLWFYWQAVLVWDQWDGAYPTSVPGSGHPQELPCTGPVTYQLLLR